MPQFLVLKTLPKGQPPGAIVELNDDEGRVFLLVGAVRVMDAAETQTVHASARRRYRRRDLAAEPR